MTLLVVLGVVVVATILAALYLSLKSGRGDEPGPGDAGAGDWPVRGGSRSGRSPSLAGRVRSMTDHGKAGGPSRRRSGRDDDEDFDVPDYLRARRASRGADSPDRSGLVTAGADQRVADGPGAAGFDDTDPSLQPGYTTAVDYNGYDAAADTRVSGPLGAGSAGYGTEEATAQVATTQARAGGVTVPVVSVGATAVPPAADPPAPPGTAARPTRTPRRTVTGRAATRGRPGAR